MTGSVEPKIFASSSPNTEINKMILTLLLSNTKLTPDKVFQGMESIHLTDVNALVKRSFWSIYVI